jgi:hypothetical protein
MPSPTKNTYLVLLRLLNGVPYAPPPPVRLEFWSMAKQCEMNGQKELLRNGYGGQAKVN